MTTTCPASSRSGAMLRHALLAAIGVLATTAADARDTAPRDLAGWTVTASNDGKGCFITKSYARPGETTLLLGIDLDGTNHLSVLNANWSIRPKDRLKLDFRLSSGGYPKHFAIGMAADGKQGFVTSFEPKFPTYFAASKELYVARGDVPVERLNLAGSGAAVAELRTCVERRRGKTTPAATARKPRGDDIPRDPFALSRSRSSKK